MDEREVMGVIESILLWQEINQCERNRADIGNGCAQCPQTYEK